MKNKKNKKTEQLEKNEVTSGVARKHIHLRDQPAGSLFRRE